MTRNEAADILCQISIFGRRNGKARIAEAVNMAIEVLKADAVPVRHGKWIGGELGHCSVCGHKGCASDIWSGCNGKLFCPNCGAVLEER